MSKNIYQKKLQDVIDELETSKTKGLSDQEVSERLETMGKISYKNRIVSLSGRSY